MDRRMQQIETMRWRGIGPHRGGRSVAVTGHPAETETFFFGASGGGIYKTTDGGISWTNISDGYVKAASVGALAIAAADPNVLYVGMGEACIRGNVSFGDGVYRSDDGGRTWSHRGLSATRHISRVRIHPEDPDRVYVAALGHAFGPNPERGVFRSTDGGRHWERVLFVSENAGAIDLHLDPHNPRILFAALWEGRRTPWGFTSGGPDSGLHVSRDGGDTWTRLGVDAGLPDTLLGRIGVAVSPARPDRVWAMVEAAGDQGGLYRSDDGGRRFQQVDHSRGPRSRPWYYTHLFADPADANTCYILSAGYYKSIDGGHNFSRISTPHGDHHDLWIDPKNPARQIHGADGGAVVTLDGGRSWSSIHNQATSEFYHVTTDTRFPYRVYGAQQDNSTITVPSASHYPALTDREWYEVGGAESGYIQVDPRDPNIVYAGSSGGGEGGRLTRYDHATHQLRDISVYPEKTAGVAAEAYTYRFQWTSPIHLSPHNPDVLYMCSNHVHRSTDAGQSWRVVSPDLTRADPETLHPAGGAITLDQTGVEVYATVFAFQESPVQPGLLWAGSDDGLLHRSADDGGSWTAVTPAELPAGACISVVEPSAHDAATAYVAAHRYKLDDPAPYLYRTTDGGAHWTAITTGIPADEYTRVIREDPTRAGLLYAGTERGVYVSFDAGEHWAALRLNLPVVPVHDLAVKDTDLVAATHGRSFWILDDLTPIRELAADPEPRTLRLFTPRDTVRATTVGRNRRLRQIPATTELPALMAGSYLAETPETGDPAVWLDAGTNGPAVIIQYYLEHEVDAVALTVSDARGTTVATLTSEDKKKGDPSPRLGKTAGSHRVVWDACCPGATPIAESGSASPSLCPLAPPGAYTVAIEAGEQRTAAKFRLLGPPNVSTTNEEYEEQFALLVRVRDHVSRIHEAYNRVSTLRSQVETWEGHLAGLSDAERLQETLSAVKSRAVEARDRLVQWRWADFEEDINFPPMLDTVVAHLFRVAASADARPTSQTYQALEVLEARVREELHRVDKLMADEVAAFNAMAREANLPAIMA